MPLTAGGQLLEGHGIIVQRHALLKRSTWPVNLCSPAEGMSYSNETQTLLYHGMWLNALSSQSDAASSGGLNLQGWNKSAGSILPPPRCCKAAQAFYERCNVNGRHACSQLLKGFLLLTGTIFYHANPEWKCKTGCVRPSTQNWGPKVN